jgi:hypothetical protein
MYQYYKRPWDEDRGDEHADWGTSVWFFEVGEDDFPVRQLEAYESGVTLKYDAAHPEDEFGGLSMAPLDPAEFSPFVISATEFEAAWNAPEHQHLTP